MTNSEAPDRAHANHASASDVFYKYTDLTGAQKILSNHTLRFALPADMNDPFDVYIDDWVGMEEKHFFERTAVALFDSGLESPESFAAHYRVDLITATNAIENFRRLSEQERIAFKDQIAAIDPLDFDRDFSRAREAGGVIRDLFAATLKNYGVFCATKLFNNLLMWAHYADRHRGAVLGFRPDMEKDSMLRLMEPVVYSKERPHVVGSPEEWVRNLRFSGVERARRIVQRLFQTKSDEWSYEREWRLAIPDIVSIGEGAGFVPFHPHELEEVYLGCRMNGDDRASVISLATTLNSAVRIYSAKLARHNYALDFERVANNGRQTVAPAMMSSRSMLGVDGRA